MSRSEETLSSSQIIAFERMVKERDTEIERLRDELASALRTTEQLEWENKGIDEWRNECIAVRKKLDALLRQKPVAWVKFSDGEITHAELSDGYSCDFNVIDAGYQPLYTDPVPSIPPGYQLVPVRDTEIEKLRVELAEAKSVRNPSNTCETHCEGTAFENELRRLRAELNELKAQEPVAWWDKIHGFVAYNKQNKEDVPLYTAPARPSRDDEPLLRQALDALTGWMDQPDNAESYDAAMQRAFKAVNAIKERLK
jgi:hypothetical protein